jgi:hypothetical protein
MAGLPPQEALLVQASHSEITSYRVLCISFNADAYSDAFSQLPNGAQLINCAPSPELFLMIPYILNFSPPHTPHVAASHFNEFPFQSDTKLRVTTIIKHRLYEGNACAVLPPFDGKFYVMLPKGNIFLYKVHSIELALCLF